jgi:two-component system, sensor histidine kinase
MSKNFPRWRNISISKKLYFVVGIMALLIVVELLTLRFAMGKLSAVRAFVGGEGLWTKGQKQAIYQLQRYAFTRDESDYFAFKEALRVNDGDHEARMELIKPNPDMAKIRQGFILGQIHPDDIESMVDLIKNFHNISYISEAIAAWTEGDLLITQLKIAGEDYHRIITSKENDIETFRDISNRIKILNDRLSQVTAKFSLVLGEGSRWLENLVFMILFALVLTVECVGFTLTFLTSRSISSGLKNLIGVAEKIGQGELDKKLAVTSGDEIGQLTIAINNMGDMLQKSYNELKESHRDLEEKVRVRTQELAEIAKVNEELYIKARNAVKIRDEFLSVASHELRTPITAMLLHLQLLEKKSKNTENPMTQEELIELSHHGVLRGKRLAHLQDVLMDLTKISTGTIDIKKEYCDIVAVAREAADQLIESTKPFPHVHFDSPVSLMGYIDPTRFSQIIINLLNNAVKYAKGSQIDLSISEDNGRVMINVTDYGPGIPEEKQAAIFNRFERANEDVSVSGLGLGLFISQQIVQQHGGKISLRSSVGKGATFIVELPLHNS